MSLTQDKVDEMFYRMKSKWHSMVLDSGMSEMMFVATDNTGKATGFLYENELMRCEMESRGFVWPTLIDGLTVKVSEVKG